MSAWLCPNCEVAFPPTSWAKKGRCLVCGAKLMMVMHRDPTYRWPNWLWQRTGLDPNGEPWPEDFPPDTSVPKDAIAVGSEGWLWVEDHIVREVGYTPASFAIVKLGDTVYELQGQNPQDGRWWIEPAGATPTSSETPGTQEPFTQASDRRI